jgi:hypothetical protein
VGEAGLSTAEVGKEITEHRHHTAHQEERRDRFVTIIEAVLLAVVALLAAASGFASAKWSTESRLALTRATAARNEASRADLAAMETRNFDASTFNTWFSGYVAGNQQAMNIAVRRFRPQFRVAFDAWIATNPASNPNAPPGPTYMPQYKQPEAVRAASLDRRADAEYRDGAKAGGNADDYVRTTVYLATVLFLVGISGHFRLRSARYGLVVVGIVILVVAIATLTTLPRPPT